MKRAVHLSALFLIAAWTASGFGGKAGYDSLPDYKTPDRKEPGVIYRPLEKSHQTMFGFTLLQHSISDVKKKFSDVVQAPVGGYHHGTAVCISAARADDRTKVLFVRIPAADLHGFVLFSGEGSVQAHAKCVPSPEVHRAIRTPGGIGLGMTKDEVLNTLGTPTRQDQNVFLYRFETSRKFSREAFEQYMADDKDADPETLYSDVRTDIKAEFLKGRLVSYTVSTTDTF